MKEQLLNRLKDYISFTKEEEHPIAEAFKFTNHKSNDYLIRNGMIAHNIYFIINGLIRVFHYEEGKEVNTYFSTDDCFFTAFTSYITQLPSIENIQCVEDTELLVISRDKMNALSLKINNFGRLEKIFAEQNYICMSNRILSLQMKSAKQRYEHFLRDSDKKIVQRMPLIHVASFLGIAPESLSRIRKEMSGV